MERKAEAMTQTRSKMNRILIAAVLVAVVFVVWYRPALLAFHTQVQPSANTTGGQVFRSGTNLFLIRLDTGSQMTVDLAQNAVFLAPEKSRSRGLMLGKFLLLSKRDLRGVDLSIAEGFDRQVPNIVKGSVSLKDPMAPNSDFSFPLPQ